MVWLVVRLFEGVAGGYQSRMAAPYDEAPRGAKRMGVNDSVKAKRVVIDSVHAKRIVNDSVGAKNVEDHGY